ncbi:hypothetical protein D3C81_888480 [compost metagenome]
MDRFEQRRKAPLRIEVGRGGDADSTGAGRSQVGQNVAEQIRRHHHIETIWLQHEARTENVDVLLVPSDVRVLRGHCRRALIPVGHADGNAVGLGGRGQTFARPGLGQIEGELENPVYAAPGEYRLLQHELMLGAFEHLAAD